MGTKYLVCYKSMGTRSARDVILPVNYNFG